MKKTILESAFLTAVILTSATASGQTSSRNYIKIRTMRDSMASQFNETVRYYDGLGRLEETVDVGITPQHNSLVSYIGREPTFMDTDKW